MKQRVYIDTSVIGGCFDEEFSKDSEALFEKFKNGEMIAVISEATLRELAEAPAEVREKIDQIPEEYMEIVPETEEASELAEHYLAAEAISRKFPTDAIHIAIATTQRVSVLVSWNFKHIVNIQRIRAYNSVNIREGYPPLEIRSPKEVLDVKD
ncbi:MAG: PIN domain-containing protein [Elusimicrobia bacterium]|nr:PIN domain-containing protein [Elusimicrobiota bacterium]